MTTHAGSGRRPRAGVTLALALAFTTAIVGGRPTPALAQGERTLAPRLRAPESRTGAYSTYERGTIDRVLARRGEALEPAPEGQAIEAIDVEVLDIIEDRDPAPGFLNVLHQRSRDHVIRREVLLRPGELYQKVVVDETARNLRRLPPLSLVICVPTRGSAPGKVRLLVIVKDIWSLRLGVNVSYTVGGLETLTLTPAELNLLGTQQTLGGAFAYYPDSTTYGLNYAAPRLFGSRVGLTAAVNVSLGRARGGVEGTSGLFEVGQPLYSTRTPWAWSVDGSWTHQVTRRYVNAALATFDADATPDDDRIPFQYRERRGLGRALFTRSFGWSNKLDVSVGARATSFTFDTSGLGAFDPAAIDEFRRRNVPVGDTRVGPLLRLRSYRTDYLRILDAETLGLQEDYRLGHDLYLQFYPVSRALGSSRDFVGLYAAALYTAALGDGYARASIESTTESEDDRLADGLLELGARVVTPRLPFGRLVFDAHAVSRYRNFLNRYAYLGGDTRLRGYPSSFFVGKDYVVGNLELRSRPLEVFSTLVGAAAFYDTGGAFDGFDQLRLHPSAGLGLRVLFPQVNRVVLRADLAFPLEAGGPPSGAAPASFFFAFDQAFPLSAFGLPVDR
ncbi:MAG: hypothetical protein MUF34_25685 [Polyangiaceae bacterium]|nr:hypothetical protein [Polyangiaceae bacterium]